MKKAGFIGSLVSIFMGAMVLVCTNIISEILPKIGWMAFQKLSSGTYSPDGYVLNFTVSNTVAVVLLAAGIIFGTYCFKSDRHSA